MGLSPTMAELLVNAIEARLADLHTGLPARVEAFNAEKNTADVQPLLIRVVLDADENAIQERIPQITNCPVLFPSFGPWVITSSLRPGDIVFLTFAERAIDHWLEAKKGDEVDPVHTRKHDLTDAIAIPALRPRTAPIAGISSDLRIGIDGGEPAIVLKQDGTIEIGQGATEKLVLGDTLVAAIQSLTVPTALGPSGPPINAAAFPPALSPLGRVK